MQLKYTLTCVFLLFLLLKPEFGYSQYTTTSCQTVTDALLGPDRNDFVHNNGIPISEGYLHNFDPPVLPCGINNPTLTSLVVNIDVTSVIGSPGCSNFPVFGNVLSNCALTTSSVCPIIEEVLTPGCNQFGGGTTGPGMFSLDLITCGESTDPNNVIGVDIIPAMDGSAGCPQGGTAISDGDVSVNYTICIDYTYDQDIPPPCVDDGDCSNGQEVEDANCNCIQINVPPPCVDDGDCSNGEEMFDANCNCVAINVPPPCIDDGDCSNGQEVLDANCNCVAINVPPPCVDDGDCSNGQEVLDANCNCVAINVPPPCVDDGDCSNGQEVLDANCNCVAINVPPPCVDDGDCSNGQEVLDANCNCVQINVPPPCVDDGNCNNGFEVFDPTTCNCNVIPPVFGCTDMMALNFDPNATCDDGSCNFTCPDPGCDDGDCTNGLETWDDVNCQCVPGIPPTPCTDDGDCTNGFEFWDPSVCQCFTTPPVFGCTDPTAPNFDPNATCDDGSCICPDPGTCDDGDCTNGFEAWDPSVCECFTTAPVLGCTDPTAPNFDPNATCDDGSCICPDPGTCDDNDCTNGIETWDFVNCECVAGTPPTPCVDDGDCTNGFEVWNTNTCNCDITPPVSGCTDPTSPNFDPNATCDDGSCICPDPGTCDDNDCTNGVETWDFVNCECVAGTPPTPCVDDGDCTNGFEIWNTNTCNCDITPPVFGCTDPMANNFDPNATCDDGSCDTSCPDPGTCDDNDCTNGVETWDFVNCECVAGTPPTPCVDDGDCTNGFEIWNTNTCNCDITPPVFGCTDPMANNFDPNATCDDGSCDTSCPDPGTCDDNDCTNGVETWDFNNCECQAGTPPTPCVDDGDCTNGFEIWNTNTCNCDITPPVFGCTDPMANNFDPNATCDDGSCDTSCPDPGTCDDNDCTNGVETWDFVNCECIAGTPPVDPGCDDGNCANGVEIWDGCNCQPGTPVDCSNGSTSVVPCDDNNGNTFNDVQTILDCDNTVCVPCQGTPCDIQANAGPNLTLDCDDNFVELTGTSSVANADFIWSGPDINNNNMGFANPAITIPGTYTLVAVDPTTNCVSAPAVVIVQDATLPIAIIQDPVASLTCQSFSDGILLDGTGSSTGNEITYQWLFNNSLVGTELTLEVFEEGLYTLWVNNSENGCENSAEITIDEPVIEFFPILAITGEICPDEADGSLQIDTVTGGQAPYLFSLTENNFSTETEFENLAAGEYTLFIQDADGCESQATLTIPAANPIVVSINSVDPVSLGDSLQLSVFTSITPDSITWEATENINCLDCLEPVIRPQNEGVYSVTIQDANGCTATDQITVLVDKEERVYIPNSFSPNQDGINDEFMIFAGSDVRIVRQLTIFNRWGAIVYSVSDFSANDPLFGWDGRHKGQDVTTGIYVYYAEIEFFDGRTEIMAGDITVVR